MAPFLYGGELAAVLAKIKYRRRDDLARRLGEWLAPRWQARLLPIPYDWVIPIPTHWRRRLVRGMDHLREILHHSRPPAPVANALVMRKHKARQVELPAIERLSNIAGIMSVRRRWQSRLRGSRVLLFDDVMTTMATISSAASALESAGVLEVHAYAIARAEP